MAVENLPDSDAYGQLEHYPPPRAADNSAKTWDEGKNFSPADPNAPAPILNESTNPATHAKT
jgi:hypothetical protein